MRIAAGTLALGLMTVSARAQDPVVALGDSMELVVEKLGPPQSFFMMGERQFLYYPQGQVAVSNGVVAEVLFQTEEELSAAAARRDQIRVQREQAEVAAAASRKEAGMRDLAARLRDPAFSSAPAAERVAYWEQFARSYPEVPVAGEYHQALQDLSREQRDAVAEVDGRARLTELEQRVSQAHAQALRAEEDAALARVRAAEAEREALLVREAVAAERPPVTTPVVEEVIYYDPFAYARPVPPREPPEPKPPPASPYSVERRYGPMGKPTFGGTP